MVLLQYFGPHFREINVHIFSRVPELPVGQIWKKYTERQRDSLFLGYNNFTHIKRYRGWECERWRNYIDCNN